jgi:hypothetical protein
MKKCENPGCENDIPDRSLSKHRDQKYCSSECARAVINVRQKENGHYQKMSQAGNEAQARYKEQHGHAPGYVNRKAALQRPGRNDNRRRRASTEER